MRYKIVYTWIVGVLLCGCSDFLEEQSQSEIRPSTVKDMEKLLEGEAYPRSRDGEVFNIGAEIFTDNQECTNVPISELKIALLQKKRARFAWESDMFDAVEFGTSDNSFWTSCYDRIKGCNIILEYADEMQGDQNRKEHLKGEAYTLRGFYYLMLTNYFGMPYNYGDPEKSLAVPLKLFSGVITDYDVLKKKSVAACYRQIEKDLLEGVKVMYEHRESQSTKLLRLNYMTAYVLLSRMYLYMEDYDNALKYANLVLEEKNELLDAKDNLGGTVYYEKMRTEIIWAVSTYFDTNTAAGDPTYVVSEDLVNCYQEDVKGGIVDIRGDYSPNVSTPGSTWIKRGTKYITLDGVGQRFFFPAYVLKGSSTGEASTSYSGGVRVAEVYLNRAEVYCRRYLTSGDVADATQALNDLNFLRSHRFKIGYINAELSDFASAEEMLAFCLRERRRELCYEGNHRWFDLRRTGMPELKHYYVEPTGFKTDYVLPENSPAYKLPIPQEVMDNNPSLKEL